jgi:tetratricopeptide (TPR) repeat protein
MFRIAALLIVPLLLLLFEGSLRLFGYGYPTDFLVKVKDREAYTGNPRFTWRFFPKSLARPPVPMHVPSEKAPRSYRIFVLGGSAAQGVPDPVYGFSRFLEVMLRDRFPQMRFEVHNAALAAVNSHAVLPIAKDCAAHDPDLFVVYMGNNEVVGPFGPGTVLAKYTPSLWAVRTNLWVKTTKLGQLLDSWLRAAGGGEKGLDEWRGMQMFLEHRVTADNPRLESVYRNLRANLRDICDAAVDSGANVLLCTVAVNLKDSPPFASEHREGLSATDLARWEEAYEKGVAREELGDLASAAREYLEAAKVDNRYAELQFRLGRCRLGLDQHAQARASFLLARDLDALRFRADARINEVIREVAAESPEGVRFVDAEKALASSARTGCEIPGEELFYEHVHLNYHGNYELARAIFPRVVSLLPEEHRSGGTDGEPPSKERCLELLVLTGHERHRMERAMWNLMGKAPFTNQLGYAERRHEFHRRLVADREQAGPASFAETVSAYAAAVEANEDDLLARETLAGILLSKGRAVEAERHQRAILQRLPDYAKIHADLGAALMAQGRILEAEKSFSTALRFTHDPVEISGRIGRTYAMYGEYAQAEAFLRGVLKLRPNLARARSALGACLSMQGRYREAENEAAEAIRLRPDEAEGHYSMGMILFGQRKYRRSAECFAETVRLDPYVVDARDKLGCALMALGEFDQAVAQFAEASRLAPDNAEIAKRHAEALQMLQDSGVGDR